MVKNVKIRISIPGTYIAADMPEEKAQKVFWKLSETLGILCRTNSARLDSEILTPEPQVYTTEDTDLPDPVEEKKEPVELSEPEQPNLKFKGFLYIKCPKCGKTRGFMSKNPTDHYHCDSCGARSEFDGPLVPLWVNCECGKSFRYFTNMDEPAFDINCLECGTPVAVTWNGKKRMYVTMRER